MFAKIGEVARKREVGNVNPRHSQTILDLLAGNRAFHRNELQNGQIDKGLFDGGSGTEHVKNAKGKRSTMGLSDGADKIV